jgi:glycosyltransferase involved in cell wall biosynthesis
MKKNVKTLFLGPFSPPYTGDGVKNDYLKEGLETAGINDIIWFDTIKRDGSSLSFYFKLLKMLMLSKQIIFSLNVRGRFTIIPVFWFLSLFSKKKGVLYIMGGAFDKQLERLNLLIRKIFVGMVNKLEGVFAESKSLKQGLEKCGLKNVEMIYNPRKDDGLRWKLTENNRNKTLFISRVTDDKGVTVLMDAIESITKDKIKISLDIYGPMDKNYEDYFNKRVEKSNGTITYKGVLKPEEVQRVMLDYQFLALPTYHSGEGLPGVLVEAGMTGIPIIITRFNALPEYFTYNKDALFVEPHDAKALKIEILRLLDIEELNNKISAGILKTVEPFKLENVIKQTLNYLNNKGWSL